MFSEVTLFVTPHKVGLRVLLTGLTADLFVPYRNLMRLKQDAPTPGTRKQPGSPSYLPEKQCAVKRRQVVPGRVLQGPREGHRPETAGATNHRQRGDCGGVTTELWLGDGNLGETTAMKDQMEKRHCYSFISIHGIEGRESERAESEREEGERKTAEGKRQS